MNRFGNLKAYITDSQNPFLRRLFLVALLVGWVVLVDPQSFHTQNIYAVQLARPSADVSNAGAWSPTPLFAEIDEPTADDSVTAVVSKNNPSTTDTFEVSLSSLNDPNASTGHIIRYRTRKQGGVKTEELRVDLYQGTTLIRQGNWTGGLGTSWTTFTDTLTSGEADAITDYTNLRLRFTPRATGGGQPAPIEVTWAEFEVPVQQASNPPSVTTNAASNIQQTEVQGNGDITDTGGGSVISRGFVWDTSSQANPGNTAPGSSGYGSNVQEGGTFSTGTFNLQLTNLSPGTTYYYRAFALNSIGYAYGSEITFTTQAALPTVLTNGATSVQQTQATGNGEITDTGGATIDERGFVWDTTTQADPGNVAPGSSGYGSTTNETGSFGTGAFNLTLSSLTSDTTYYYRSYAHNSEGYSYGSEVEFTTLGNFAAVVTNNPTNISQTSVDGNGNITDIGQAQPTERGFVWDTATQGNPGNVAPGSSGYGSTTNETGSFGTGTYSLPITGLTANTTYYYRAYVLNTAGYSYGDEIQFSTLDELPDLNTSAPSNIQTRTVTGNGEITNTGGLSIDERGFVWDTSAQSDPGNVAPGSSGYGSTTNETGTFGTGTFSLSISNLSPNTTYYYRSYAHNSQGYGYGPEVSFTTLNAQFGRPDTDITTTGWTPTPLWEELNEQDPDNATTEITTADNPTNTVFEVAFSSITDPQTSSGHYVRYRMYKTGGKTCTATAELYQGGTAIHSDAAQTLTGTYATYSFNLSGAEADSITDYSDLRIRVTANCTGGGAGSQVRATWAEFEAPEPPPTSPPSVTTQDATNIQTYSATGNGEITSTGSSTVTERGFVWDTTSQADPGNTAPGSSGYGSSTNETGSFGTGTFNLSMTSLSKNTTYYYRAYAQNSVGFAYGSEKVFTTFDEIPTLTTNNATNVGSNTADGNGVIDHAGTSAVTERGFVWDTATQADPGNVSPASSGYGSSTNETGSFGAGSYSLQLSGLTSDTTYYYRAYAQNSTGYAYGEELEFTTQGVYAQLTTLDASNRQTNQVDGNGNITFIGVANPTVRGFVWDRTSQTNPGDIAPGSSGYSDSVNETGSFGTGTYSLTLNSLLEATIYYYRAFALNSAGYSYGNEVQFNTTSNYATMNTLDATNLQPTQVTGNGEIVEVGIGNPTDRGFVWGTSSQGDPGDVTPAFSGYSNNISQSGDFGPGQFSLDLTSLTEDTTYYYRSFAQNSNGYSYGPEVQFQTPLTPQPPTLTNVSINGGSNISLIEGTTTPVAVTATADDPNGWEDLDLTSATAVVYRSGVTDTCTADDNNCYTLTSSSCTLTSCSGTSCSLTCTADVQFFAEATDTGSTYESENWLGKISISDEGGLSDTEITPSGVELFTLLALDVTSTIDYGSLNPGSDTGATNQTTVVTNTGNTLLNPDVSGTNMTGPGASVITVSEQKFSTSLFTYSSGGTVLSLTDQASGITLAKPTSTTPVTDDLFWGISVPSGLESGSYTGQNTFTASQ